jgi:hypothetical protein
MKINVLICDACSKVSKAPTASIFRVEEYVKREKIGAMNSEMDSARTNRSKEKQF